MGAAYDAMCENEYLEEQIKSKNRKIREQKKLIIEFSDAIVRHLSNFENSDIQWYDKAKDILTKCKKKNKQ